MNKEIKIKKFSPYGEFEFIFTSSRNVKVKADSLKVGKIEYYVSANLYLSTYRNISDKFYFRESDVKRKSNKYPTPKAKKLITEYVNKEVNEIKTAIVDELKELDEMAEMVELEKRIEQLNEYIKQYEHEKDTKQEILWALQLKYEGKL